MLKEFKDFIARGNVVDLAVAVIIGAAFGKIITSLVDGIIMPPIGLLFGKVEFASLFYVLNHAKGDPVSLADAKAKGIPVIAYGAFINEIVTFLIVALIAGILGFGGVAGASIEIAKIIFFIAVVLFVVSAVVGVARGRRI